MKKGNFTEGNLTTGNCTVYSESNDENITLPCDRLEMYNKYEQWIHNRTWNETSNETWEERSKPARNKTASDEPNSFISFWEEENFPKKILVRFTLRIMKVMKTLLFHVTFSNDTKGIMRFGIITTVPWME